MLSGGGCLYLHTKRIGPLTELLINVMNNKLTNTVKALAYNQKKQVHLYLSLQQSSRSHEICLTQFFSCPKKLFFIFAQKGRAATNS